MFEENAGALVQRHYDEDLTSSLGKLFLLSPSLYFSLTESDKKELRKIDNVHSLDYRPIEGNCLEPFVFSKSSILRGNILLKKGIMPRVLENTDGNKTGLESKSNHPCIEDRVFDSVIGKKYLGLGEGVTNLLINRDYVPSNEIGRETLLFKNM